MNELMLEIYSEEMPARMQIDARQQTNELFEKILTANGASFESVRAFVAPQRLAIQVHNLQPLTQGTSETRRGPRAGAPDAALAGFAKSTGQNQDQWTQQDGYWYADMVQPGRAITDLLPQIVTAFLDQFSWPKSMRWHNPETNTFTRPWIRPIRSILCVYNKKSVSFKIEGLDLVTSNQTAGHRFLAPESITVEDFTNYHQHLRDAFVILDHQERQSMIKKSLDEQANLLGLSVQENQTLLDEVTGLVDYPFVHIGKVDAQFMHLPDQVLSTSMRVHQKYFSLLKGDKLAPYFGVVTNVNPSGNRLPSQPISKEMMAGYERVLKARLSDAAFFYETDLKTPLQNLVPKLDSIIFHAKLGTLGQKCQRLQNLMTTEQGRRAALLCKTDLVTHMVGEFPELQGVMGQIYATANGEPEDVALALKEYYQPVGPHDTCPTAPLSIELALADKVDTLIGFLGVGIKPTGSKDPFGLRRAALGIIRLLVDHQDADFNLRTLFQQSAITYQNQKVTLSTQTVDDALHFINDRLTVYLQGQNLDCVGAVLTGAVKAPSYNVQALFRRSLALHALLKTSAGTALKAAYKRASGILDKAKDSYHINRDLLNEPAEKDLYHQLQDLLKAYDHLFASHQYQQLMEQLASIRPFIDAFFDNVMVNCDEEAVRLNRYALLQLFVQAVDSVADFGQLQG
ncbi:glycine--tRNA ligase subunit beta [Candidatus Finniella inopinata]|uniref:Glycine--tRNA ligase beta subunit n=1 Tax=Candidatus Finniella inopinata TaxID=1696036 RepID=A0A4Q7DG28_9PROT|nr:glycine--tRNA ligase subunit beta [Candidatus Finniella inopinata]RZI45138.1 glycine--tRNA ligase subunit beta [Candidatus Finniella inopinata]